MKLDPLDGADEAEALPLWRRVGWMAAIWGISVATLGVVAFLIRAWIA
ncbi:DUF2474 domain-containing protein [Novosphingopyxis iocasae]|nr:DUF2474 domain-containing protein [Novosphingopyxis iocasae]MAC12508.1 DUF2474 domain-containing protein [Sphingorhabdus sp.]|tara:strand:- start:33 stop:176 length:144 start_codon:yes stop_codon:yes gene_type:complete